MHRAPHASIDVVVLVFHASILLGIYTTFNQGLIAANMKLENSHRPAKKNQKIQNHKLKNVKGIIEALFRW